MAKQAVVKVSGGKDRGGDHWLFEILIEKGVVEAILIPKGASFRRWIRSDIDP